MSGQGGFTLVELVIAVLGLIVISALMVTWFMGVTTAEQAQGDADEAARQAVETRERITRDLRRARRVTSAMPLEIRVWLDDDGNGILSSAEEVTWRIESDGRLVRIAGDVSRLEAIGLDPSRSGFTYDSSTPALVGTVDLRLLIGAGRSERLTEATIFLRNAQEA